LVEKPGFCCCSPIAPKNQKRKKKKSTRPHRKIKKEKIDPPALKNEKIG